MLISFKASYRKLYIAWIIHIVNATLVYDFIVWLTLISIYLIYSYSFLMYFIEH